MFATTGPVRYLDAYPPAETIQLNTRGLIGIARVLAGAAVRPRLLGLLIRSAWRFRARGWYRRPPFLPLPPPEYVDWRLHTAYGEVERAPSPDELERYLRWALETGR